MAIAASLPSFVSHTEEGNVVSDVTERREGEQNHPLADRMEAVSHPHLTTAGQPHARRAAVGTVGTFTDRVSDEQRPHAAFGKMVVSRQTSEDNADTYFRQKPLHTFAPQPAGACVVAARGGLCAARITPYTDRHAVVSFPLLFCCVLSPSFLHVRMALWNADWYHWTPGTFCFSHHAIGPPSFRHTTHSSRSLAS